MKPLTPITILDSRLAVTDEDACSDIRARVFCSEQRDAFFDILSQRVELCELRNLYRCIERQKKNQYGEGILQVDNGTFTPLVFSSLEGMLAEETEGTLQPRPRTTSCQHNFRAMSQ